MFGRISSSEKIIVVADVGSGSAAVAILVVHPEGPATIIASNRVILPFEERSADATSAGVIASLADAAQKTLAAYSASPYKNKQISSTYAVIRAPWTRSQTEHATSASEKDIRVTDPMIAALAQQAIAAETTLAKTNLIESTVVRVMINGYATSLPVGKTGRKLSVAVLLSDCDPAIRQGVAETLSRIFPSAKPILRSGARALITATKALADLNPDHVILDVEGEATNVLVVRDGLATTITLIPEGVHSILTRITEKGLPEETLSLLRMAEHDESSDEATMAIKTSVARVEPELARVYGEALSKIAIVSRLPTDLILVTNPDLAPWLSRFFSRIDFSQCTLTSQPFSVRALMSADLGQLAAPTSGVSLDIGISIASALVNSEAQG